MAAGGLHLDGGKTADVPVRGHFDYLKRARSGRRPLILVRRSGNGFWWTVVALSAEWASLISLTLLRLICLDSGCSFLHTAPQAVVHYEFHSLWIWSYLKVQHDWLVLWICLSRDLRKYVQHYAGLDFVSSHRQQARLAVVTCRFFNFVWKRFKLLKKCFIINSIKQK